MQVYIQKETGTYADTLKAVGLADLLREVTSQDVRIRNVGSHFEIEGANPPPVESWHAITPGYPYILDAKDKDIPQGKVLDYEREKEKVKILREFRQATGKKGEKVKAALKEQSLSAPEQPDKEYQMALFLAMMRKGWSSDKQLYRWIMDNQDSAKAQAAKLLGLNAGIAEDNFPAISNSQVFNPIAGKGVHRPKPDSASPSSISKAIIDGSNEWLKFRGAYKAMLPYRAGDDFKVFVIEPGDISMDAIGRLRSEMLALSLYGNLRLDIDTSLRLLQILIMNSDAFGQGINLFGRFPARVVAGLHQAYFQSLGNAAALMNYAFMPLPSWFAVTDQESANAYLEIIKEHASDKNRDGETGCLRVLNEDNSGDIPVLQSYREWLSTGSLDTLLDFLSLFALKVVERRGRNEWVREFSVEGLNELLGRGYKFVLDIITNDGFKNVARAIRNATIYALSLKRREVHFGLAQEWKQKIKGGAKEFVPALANFVQRYNWESEKIKAHVVKQEDLDAVIGLIDEHGAELVGMLLLAYGYARAPKIEQDVEKGEVLVEA